MIDRQAARLHKSATTRRHAEDIRVLPGAGICHEKAREVRVHAGIEQLTPRCRDRIRGVAKNVKQADIVKAHARHEGVLGKHLSRFGEHSIIFPVISDDAQDFFRRHVDSDAIWDLKTRDFALVRVLKTLDIKLAVALVDLAVAIFRA